MKATDVLREGHATLDRLIETIITHPDGPECLELLEHFVVALEIHRQIEEELFYPELAALSGLIPEARQDHAQLSSLATGIDRRDPGSPDFRLRLGDLRDALRRHVTEEERSIFAAAERLPAENLEAIGRRLANRKRELIALLAEARRPGRVA